MPQFDPNDPATWDVIAPVAPTPAFIGPMPVFQFTPKKPTLAPASPTPPAGNAIATNPLKWNQILVSALVVGAAIWLIEQNVSQKYATILVVILLLGAAYNYKNFASELQAITKGKA